MRKINDGLTRQQRYYLRHRDNPEYKARKKRAQAALTLSGWKQAWESNRRVRKNNQTPEMNIAEWVEVEAMYTYNHIMPGIWHVDHVDPIANGGIHHPTNLQILSEHDNCSKGDRL